MISNALKSDAILIGAALVGVYFLSTATGRALVANLTGAAIDAAGNAGAGVVVGIGEAVGIPPTNLDQCQRDIDAGRIWESSFSCPLGRFLAQEKSYIPPDP